MSPAAAADAPFGLSSIGQIAITITDLERAVAFYRDTLGLRLLFQVPGLAFFRSRPGGLQKGSRRARRNLRLSLPATPQPGKASALKH